MALDELNDKLHGRDVHLDRTRRPDVFRPEDDQVNPESVAQFQETEVWNDGSLPVRTELTIPEPVQAVFSPDERGQKRRKYVALFLGSIALIALLAGILMKVRSGLFSEKNIVLEFSGPSETASAEPVSFDFEYTNNNWMGIDGGVVVFEYPESFHPAESPNLMVKKSRAELSLGTIASQGRGTVTLSGKFYGSKGEDVKIGAVLRYSPATLSTAFEKRVERTVRIISSPLSLEIAAPLELASDQEAQYEVFYKNPGDISFSNLSVKLEYPAGFLFAEADPRPSSGDSVFSIGTLEAREEGKIVVKGRLTGLRDEQKTISGSIGVLQGDGKLLSYGDHQRKTKVVASPLSIRQRVNGSSSGAINPGEILNYEIEYRNEGNVGIRDAIITLEIDSPYIDFSTLSFSGFDGRGSYSQSRKAISWKASDYAALSRIEPGQSGRVAFKLKTYAAPESRVPDGKNPFIQSVAKIDSPDIPALVGFTKVIASSTLTLKMNSVISGDLLGYYTDLLIPNTGPIPPAVGQETTYTLRLALRNSSNTVDGSRVSISLPTGVRYTGKTAPETEKVLFNDRANELIWDIGSFLPGTTREFAFQIAIIPDPSSVGGEVPLVNRSSFVGKDSFTGNEIRFEKGIKSSTLLEDVSVGLQGRVVEAVNP